MRYVCRICGYVYDDAKEKVPFADLPQGWRCPMCGASKSDFEMENTVKSEAPAQVQEPAEEMRVLNPGQLSALCSNLARGCEKQYKSEEASLFSKLSEAFRAYMPMQEDATVEELSRLLAEDTKNYASLRATADAAQDRGAARVCVWGEKVTRMLSSLVERYKQEGEAMLQGQEIWVCTVCGFVYIGKEAPALCPVCKVPAWKFEKMEGKAAL